jgi:tRNA 2-thiouridine synthesizing protein A
MADNDPILDARGHRCPVPTLKLRRALQSAGCVTLLADDPMAQIDVPHFCTQNGFTLELQETHENHWLFRVRRADDHGNT